MQVIFLYFLMPILKNAYFGSSFFWSQSKLKQIIFLSLISLLRSWSFVFLLDFLLFEFEGYLTELESLLIPSCRNLLFFIQMKLYSISHFHLLIASNILSLTQSKIKELWFIIVIKLQFMKKTKCLFLK